MTGGTGFLGAHLLDGLLHRTPVAVHCLVRLPQPDTCRTVREAGDLGEPQL
ncbi:SDR family oxidoreductase [Streptomyces sp. NPDC001816]|uniref:SDR family oxidoreductase n=1 Tax=Streptomyces sp. NPDC001816 TaxID=3364612 RepID=UPI0036D12557